MLGGYDQASESQRFTEDTFSCSETVAGQNIRRTVRSMKRVKQRTRVVIGRTYRLSLEEVITLLNPVIRGWDTYQTSVQAEQKRFRQLNQFVWDRRRIFLTRKYSDASRGTRRASDDLFIRLGLVQFGKSW